MAEKIEIYTDGASKGNPGKAGAGIVILKDKEVVLEKSVYLGLKTNNEAEYLALINALQFAKKFEKFEVDVYTDSNLLANQMSGLWKIKEEHLFLLFEKAKGLEKSFLKVKYYRIPREKNKRADFLANKAVFNLINS